MNVSVRRPVLFIATQVSLQKGVPACPQNNDFNTHGSQNAALYFNNNFNNQQNE